MKHLDQKQLGQEPTQARSPEAGADALATEGGCSLACSFSLFPYRPHDPGMAPTHNRLGPPQQSLIRKMPTGLPTAQSHRGIFSTKITSSQTTLPSVKLT